MTMIQTGELSSRLRLAVARLQRILRQQAMGGLNLTQLACLATIQREGPIPLGELANRERLSPPQITKVVTKLEKAGLVKRRVLPEDRRVSLIATSAKGRALVEDVKTRRTMYLNQRLAALNTDELAALERALPILEWLAEEES
jgi:DNA-binding MarR family transcriptional regulator